MSVRDPVAHLPVVAVADDLRRLLLKSESSPDSDCVLFTGHVRPSGYATLWSRRTQRKELVHRLSYRIVVGPIPEGYEVDHLCGVRHCINPAHLEAVTKIVNTRRSARGNARKTHCDHGHEFTPENTYYRHDRIGRICRACGARRRREILARRRQP